MHPYNRGQKSIKRTKKTFFFYLKFTGYTHIICKFKSFSQARDMSCPKCTDNVKKNGILIIFAKVKIKVLHGTGIMEGETIS